MPKADSAKKRERQARKRRIRNKAIMTRVRSRISGFRLGLARNDADMSQKLREVISVIDRAVAKGVLVKNSASRRKARLARVLSKMLKEVSAKSSS